MSRRKFLENFQLTHNLFFGRLKNVYSLFSVLLRRISLKFRIFRTILKIPKLLNVNSTKLIHLWQKKAKNLSRKLFIELLN